MSDAAAFLRAVGNGDIHLVRDLLAADPGLADAVGPHPSWGGRPQALHVAVETGRADMVALLLDAGADPNGRNGDYDLWSPLMLALQRGHADISDALIDRGARIGLVEALLMKDDATVDALLADGLPPLVPNGGSILAFARTTRAIDHLVKLGAPLDQKDKWGVTPMEAMSRTGEDAGTLVNHLVAGLGMAADPVACARAGDREMLTALAERDREILRRDAVMMAAVDGRRHDLAHWLLAMGADANARADGQSRQTALHNAARNGDLDMVKLFVEHGADLHARDDEHDATPRGWAETSARITNNSKCMDVAAWLQAQGG